MDNVLVNFTAGDQSGITQAVSGLQDLLDKNTKVGQAWADVVEKIKAENKTILDGNSQLAKSYKTLSDALASGDKAVIGGAYKQYLKDLQTQMGLTTKELEKYITTKRKEAQTRIFSTTDQDTINKGRLAIEAMNNALKNLGLNEDGTKQSSQQLISQIRAMKDELLKMAQAGQAGTPAFEALKAKVSETQQAVTNLNTEVKNTASDTRNIDGLISAVSGVAGAFSVAQGASALFGDANKDVAQALLKVQAAMAILNGLQEVAHVLQKESSANIFLNSLFRTKNAEAIATQTVATEADIAAKGAETVATEGATVAQEELNVAMDANPVGLLLIGIIALTGAISALNDNTRLAADLQDEFNKSLDEAGQFADFDIKKQKERNDVIVANAKTEGKSQAELIALQGNLNNEVLATIKKKSDAAAVAANKELDQINQLQQLGIEVDKSLYDSHAKLIKEKEALDKQYDTLYQQQLLARAALEKQLAEDNIKSAEAYINAQVAFAVAGTDKERDVQIAALKQIAATRENDPAFKALTSGEQFLARAQTEKQILALQLQNYQHYLKGRTDLYDAFVANDKLKLLQNEVDSIASINKITDAQIAAIKRQRQEQLSSPTLNEGERAKIIAESNLQIATLEKQKQEQLLQIDKAGINAQLVLSKKGSLDEYQFKIQAIENEQKIALEATQLTQQQIDEINAIAQKKKIDAEKAFTQAQLKEEVDRDNAALGRFGITEDAKLELTLKRLADQKAIEISQAEGDAAAIAAIDIKYDKEIRDAKIANIEEVKNKELAAYQAYHDQVINLDKRIAASNTSATLRISALQDLKNEQEGEIQIEINALEKKKALIEDYDVQYQALMNKKLAISQEIEKRITEVEQQEIDKRVNNMQTLFDIFKQGFQSFLPQDGFSVALTSLENFGTKAFGIFSNLKEQVKNYNKIISDPHSQIGDVLLAAAEKKKAEGDATRQAELLAVQATQEAVNQIYADSAAKRQQELQDNLAALEDEKQKELNNQNLTKQQQADINAKYAAREKQEKLKAWKADQKAKESQAVINGLLAITATFAEFGWPAGIIPAAIQAGLTGIIVTKIATQEPPKFKAGKVNIQGPGTSTSDSIPAMVSRGESVIKADATAKWQDALLAMQADNFESYLINKFHEFAFPSVPDNVHVASMQKIDYEKLATAMASKMKGVIPGEKSMHFNIDETGIHAIVVDGNNKTEFKNKRYSMS